MPRIARIVIPELEHHVTQRGNNRQDVFFVADDRRAYLDILREQCALHRLRVTGYCLMTNHVHLLVVPSSAECMAKAMGRTHFHYSQYINRLHNRSGHLWQNRFYSCTLGGQHRAPALCYIERNPVRAGIVRHAWEYEWSSASAHLGGADQAGLLDLRGWQYRPREWQQRLERAEDDETLAAIRRSTSRGRPLAGDSFLSKLEHTLGKRLRALPVGRPRKDPK